MGFFNGIFIHDSWDVNGIFNGIFDGVLMGFLMGCSFMIHGM